MTQGYHYGLIVTKKKTINEVLSDKSYDILMSILFCIYAGPEHEQYALNLLASSMNLYTIGILIYKGKDSYTKLSKRRYETELFEAFAETVDEVEILLQRLGFEPASHESQYVYNVLHAMKPMILEWLTLVHEIVYTPEFAYHIDYCIRNRVEQLPEPIVKDIFPSNYPADYLVCCDEGIAKTIYNMASFH